MHIDSTLFAYIFAASMLLFAFSVYRRVRLIRLGRPVDRLSGKDERTESMMRFAIGQLRVAKGPFGLNHVIIFWSFLVLALANAEFLIAGIFPAVTFSVLPDGIYRILLFSFDVVSLAALLAIVAAMIRRAVRPPFAEARTAEAFFILAMIGSLMVAYFALHGAEIALGEKAAGWYLPVSGVFASFFSGMTPEAIASAGVTAWWVHAIVLLVFMNYLPFGKHMHILTAIPSVYFRDLQQPTLPNRQEYAKGNSYGVSQVDEYTWKDLLDSFSCTECGRCQNNCPASRTGKPLSPRLLLHSIRDNLIANGPALAAGGGVTVPLIGEGEASVSEDAIWSCMTCGSCVQQCPVFLEQMPKLIPLRRYLVEMKSKFPEELFTLFENIEQRSNPWGIAPGERGKWASALNVPDFKEGETEYLLFVGCAGSFDSRSKQVTAALSTVLQSAGVTFGILGRDEQCCGDSLRRLGNEYVFDKLAKENTKMFIDRGVKKIITQCPHCFTTLKNDYKQYGAELTVLHHSELIAQLVAEGKLKMDAEAQALGAVTYHDSCYLGRHNGVYDAPREVLENGMKGQLAEMSDTGEKSFCCGAGGGRMWLEEHIGDRVNVARVKQAAETGAKTVCTACPYCMTMFEDGVKDISRDDIRVKDIAELVAERLPKKKKEVTPEC